MTSKPCVRISPSICKCACFVPKQSRNRADWRRFGSVLLTGIRSVSRFAESTAESMSASLARGHFPRWLRRCVSRRLQIFFRPDRAARRRSRERRENLHCERGMSAGTESETLTLRQTSTGSYGKKPARTCCEMERSQRSDLARGVMNSFRAVSLSFDLERIEKIRFDQPNGPRPHATPRAPRRAPARISGAFDTYMP